MKYYKLVVQVNWGGGVCVWEIFIPGIVEAFLNFVIEHSILNPLGLVGFAAKQNRRFCSCGACKPGLQSL